ncbi:MAG: carbohydrate kinase family protein [Endomicrobia bacterium]|nr:carbohydrate kinase family protein [Endomicrobiia bacterium]
MKKFDIYLYGMILRTNSFLLCDKFPQADTYSEIKEKYCLLGGETGSAATVLASLGCRIKMDGNHIGYNSADAIKKFYDNIGVNISALYFNPDYDGLEEYIIIDNETRTVFGTFASYYQEKIVRWNTPLEEDIKQAKVAGIDPFFGEESILAARFCGENRVPFVTIDLKYDNEICRNASVIVVSSEYIRDNYFDYYSEEGKNRLLQKYMKNTNALVIFTGGSGIILYGRNGKIKKIPSYKVNVVSTLGAGDTFKAGCVYGLLQSWEDDKIVSFATACAAVACTRFPLQLYPPKLDEVLELMKNRN